MVMNKGMQQHRSEQAAVQAHHTPVYGGTRSKVGLVGSREHSRRQVENE